MNSIVGLGMWTVYPLCLLPIRYDQANKLFSCLHLLTYIIITQPTYPQNIAERYGSLSSSIKCRWIACGPKYVNCLFFLILTHKIWAKQTNILKIKLKKSHWSNQSKHKNQYMMLFLYKKWLRLIFCNTTICFLTVSLKNIFKKINDDYAVFKNKRAWSHFKVTVIFKRLVSIEVKWGKKNSLLKD